MAALVPYVLLKTGEHPGWTELVGLLRSAPLKKSVGLVSARYSGSDLQTWWQASVASKLGDMKRGEKSLPETEPFDVAWEYLNFNKGLSKSERERFAAIVLDELPFLKKLGGRRELPHKMIWSR